MLALDIKQIFCKDSVLLERIKNGKAVFSKACALSESYTLRLFIDCHIGLYRPVLCIGCDRDGKQTDIDFSFTGKEGKYDVYELTFDIGSITNEPDILFFTVRLCTGNTVFYYSSVNNVDGVLSEKPEEKFKLLVYADDYTTPDWYKDSVMYQIFVDRFYKGSKSVPVKDGAFINGDWYDGIPQYAEKPGDELSNNMFFGGTLFGVAEKIPYLASIGVDLIYLCPVFDAYSNHKYDIGDYSRIDSMFGGEEALSELISVCDKAGIRIIFDGVFNHTGDDSLYFNRYGKYSSVGAYQSKDSPYADWYYFKDFPDDYECWWGVKILPKLNCKNGEVEEYLAGDNGIVAKYLKAGISGFRLDVADELPDSFLERLRTTVKNVKPDALIIGEVWENAADKCAYGARRKYFRGRQLDGVMNYPIRNGIVDFVKYGDEKKLYDAVCDIYSSYPDFVSQSLMNILGTHDTERILTVLGTERYKELSNRELSQFTMTQEEREIAEKRLLCASVLQYILPGVPSVFYGDEAGVEGGHDPFCRKTYPWGKENVRLVEHYRRLGKMRSENAALRRGSLLVSAPKDGVIRIERKFGDETVLCTVNCSQSEFEFEIPKNSEILFGTVHSNGTCATLGNCGMIVCKTVYKT